MEQELDKLDRVRELQLPIDLFVAVPPKVLQSFRQRAAVEAPYEFRRHPEPLLITLLAAYCHVRGQDLTDTLVELLLELRHEIQEALNVIEHWNNVNDFIRFGKGGEFATNQLDEQEISMLALHLVQICLVYINTLMIQRVLESPDRMSRLTKEDRRGLTPLLFGHTTPYGSFRLDMKGLQKGRCDLPQ